MAKRNHKIFKHSDDGGFVVQFHFFFHDTFEKNKNITQKCRYLLPMYLQRGAH